MLVVENVLENGIKTKDLGGRHTTVKATGTVCREIEILVGRSIAERALAILGVDEKRSVIETGKTPEQAAGEEMVERIMAHGKA
jgi:hypothetical protein